jgi:hypothetical protein
MKSIKSHKVPTCKTNVKAINKEGKRVQVRDGYESLGVGKGTKVYEVETDIFHVLFH